MYGKNLLLEDTKNTGSSAAGWTHSGAPKVMQRTSASGHVVRAQGAAMSARAPPMQ